MRALVIDDSKPVRGILAKMLRELDFETTMAENGQEALDLLPTIGVPDLFMVNWNMPKVDGLHFIRAVRADPQQAQVPLVVVSGETDDRTIDCALKAGANDFLTKPVARNHCSGRFANSDSPG